MRQVSFVRIFFMSNGKDQIGALHWLATCGILLPPDQGECTRMSSGTTASPVCVCYLKLSVMVYLKSVSRLSPPPNVNVFVVVVVDFFLMGKAVFFLLLRSLASSTTHEKSSAKSQMSKKPYENDRQY